MEEYAILEMRDRDKPADACFPPSGNAGAPLHSALGGRARHLLVGSLEIDNPPCSNCHMRVATSSRRS